MPNKKARKRIARINAQPFTIGPYPDGTVHHYSAPNKKGKRKITIVLKEAN